MPSDSHVPVPVVCCMVDLEARGLSRPIGRRGPRFAADRGRWRVPMNSAGFGEAHGDRRTRLGSGMEPDGPT